MPLFEAENEHEILNTAMGLITFSSLSDQKDLLSNIHFLSIVNSALLEMDEARPEVLERIVQTFAEPLRETAKLRLEKMIDDTSSSSPAESQST